MKYLSVVVVYLLVSTICSGTTLNRDLEYPKEAVSKCLSGSVTLRFTIGDSRDAKNIEVISSTPLGVFDKAAIKNWGKLTFGPNEISSFEKQGDKYQVTLDFNIGEDCVVSRT